ncbi:hypothetical protein Q75_13175 [Bacillus coahuilensis p1.1.43]|uniref:Uncharacterized protein n=2 Tax=Bacillus coahuilensis TaxID=408580 RepID=A0A147K5Z3_9BACI|nr:tetratricopeptide repeat protein [Bacillus coahuilensis]KUP05266.1 hypothetical protein Q75_13175 [Bacillus coahuilensis p1.1.43]
MKKSTNMKEKGKLLSFVPTGEYYFHKGITAYNRKDLKKAKKYLERARELEPLEPIILCQLAIVLTDLGCYQESVDLLVKVLDSLDPNMLECHYFLANNYAHLGSFKEAYQHAKGYLDLEPNGDYIEEVEDLLDLLELDDEEAMELLYEQDELMVKQEEARKLLENGQYHLAIEMLSDVIVDYPEFWSAYNNLALAHFYLGEMEQAGELLKEVLEKNPGNLHALCNLAVFHYYRKEETELAKLVEGLEKVRPMTSEHRFKLGATFALIEHHTKAYGWLKNLQKQGFEGDASFHYWLSKAAYYSGNKQTAEAAWKKVVLESPEKEGQEPWKEPSSFKGFEEHIPSVMKKLSSDQEEERLFALFLMSVSKKREEILKQPKFYDIQSFTVLEKLYLAEILQGNRATQIEPEKKVKRLHETALHLYRHYDTVDSVSAGLFLLWFTIGKNALAEGDALQNPRALAAATELVWLELRSEPTTQKGMAEKYHMSSATVSKYLKVVKQYLL